MDQQLSKYLAVTSTYDSDKKMVSKKLAKLLSKQLVIAKQLGEVNWQRICSALAVSCWKFCKMAEQIAKPNMLANFQANWLSKLLSEQALDQIFAQLNDIRIHDYPREITVPMTLLPKYQNTLLGKLIVAMMNDIKMYDYPGRRLYCQSTKTLCSASSSGTIGLINI